MRGLPGDYSLTFNEPAWLVLLALAPLVWWLGRRGLASLGAARGGMLLAIRLVALLALVLAIAEVQIARTSRRVNVFYLVDRSLSISGPELDRAVEFVNASMEKRDRARGDRVGVISFGREPALETALVEDAPPVPTRSETAIDPEYTNLADALKLAQASFPPEGAKRVVILSDGDQNFGDALQQARSLAEASIGIDVVPLRRPRESDVTVDKIVVSGEPRQGAPFEVRVVLDNDSRDAIGQSVNVAGQLTVERRAGDSTQIISDEHVAIEPGRRVFSLREELQQPDFYSYEARFVPDDPTQDLQPRNNRASGFARVRGPARVLLIEDAAHRGEFDYLVERLKAAALHVTVQPSNQLFSNLAELQRYDTVVLANVPRAGTFEVDSVAEFTDEQIELLVRNTQQLGSGLIMLGGSNSFGAGGWTNTALERAMPVDFQIKALKVVPLGAVVLVIDRSGSMTGEKLEMAKASTAATAGQLGDRDLLGVVAFDAAAEWVVPMTRASDRDRIASRVGRLGAGGGTNMYPAMQLAHGALAACEASVKHMILLTDGETEGSGYAQLAARIRRDGITISTVSVGVDAERKLLESIARAGGGKFYYAKSAQALPRIFMNEARRVARPLVYEDPAGFTPKATLAHEIVRGIPDTLPPITGLVMTTPKNSPLVEIAITSPKPDGATPLLASWTYGIGKVVALTTDAGARWAHAWTAWSGYEGLFGQIVRWSLRPSAGDDQFVVATHTQDGKTRVVASAVDERGLDAVGFDLVGTLLRPDMKSDPLVLRKTAPGRYVGEFASSDPGNYFLTVAVGGDFAPLRVAVNVGYSAEFKDRGTNDTLLRGLAEMAPKGGTSGAVVSLATQDAPDAANTDAFRPGLAMGANTRDAWQLLAFVTACLFFADVFMRRVQLGGWLPAALSQVRIRLSGRKPADSLETLGRLRSRKEQLAGQFSKAAARFDQQGEIAAAEGQSPIDRDTPLTLPEMATVAPHPPAESDSYTARLLKAKLEARQGRRAGHSADPFEQ